MRYLDLERSPGYQLWLATNAFQRIVRRTLEPLHLTHVQLVLISAIDMLHRESELCGEECYRHIKAPDSDLCVTQSVVARFAGTDENMTSQVIRSLEQRGLIERREHPTDARARCLSLTPSGGELLARAKALVLPERDRFFAPLGPRAADLADLLREVVEAHRDEH